MHLCEDAGSVSVKSTDNQKFVSAYSSNSFSIQL
jgi:hypothetical protein